MPYELSFTKPLDVPRSDDYINECCYGGDVISDELQPLVTARYGDVEANQEDWGWFLWFREGDVRLAIDIMCDDPAAGEFRVRLTSRKRGLLFTKVVDTPSSKSCVPPSRPGSRNGPACRFRSSVSTSSACNRPRTHA